uniref:Uncharacterized protein n=1 Tax=Anguilla anguilla TaxID=7936 RepID=A0A0E9W5J4_ANGAN
MGEILDFVLSLRTFDIDFF